MQGLLKTLTGALLALAMGLVPGAASAQISDDWKFGAQIYAVFPSIDGTANFPASGSDPAVSVDTSKVLDGLKFAFLDVIRGEEGPLGRLHGPGLPGRRRQPVGLPRSRHWRHPPACHRERPGEPRPQGHVLDDRRRVRARVPPGSHDGRLRRRAHGRRQLRTSTGASTATSAESPPPAAPATGEPMPRTGTRSSASRAGGISTTASAGSCRITWTWARASPTSPGRRWRAWATRGSRPTSSSPGATSRTSRAMARCSRTSVSAGRWSRSRSVGSSPASPGQALSINQQKET